nr:M1 family metallopeptidase [Nocardioides luti]
MRPTAAGLVVAALLLGGCTSDGNDDPSADPSSAPAGNDATAAGTVVPAGGTPTPEADDPRLDAAVSDTTEDRVYPRVGDPGVDALSYDLDLAWTPRTHLLTAVETVVVRATADADHLQLDLAKPLEVSAVTVDGEDATYDHPGKDLVIHTDVGADERYVLEISYAGVPRPVAAPTTRSDFSTTGWTVDSDDGVWTMQEPFGAYSWYAVNDQPGDKAFYSFTIAAPSPMVGVANGELTSRTTERGTTVTRWELDRPAASYLVTIAIGDYDRTKDRSGNGVPLSYWTPRSAPFTVKGLRQTADALDWVEGKLGPYPFDSLGILLVDSRSGMETQTMITLGTTDYTTSPEVIVHEIVHQWYGDEVTPADWRDVWMNEGMAMYLQGVYQAETSGQTVDELMDYWATFEPRMRRESGPPHDYDPATFGEGNIYYGPALMWHELRQRIGDAEFWRLVREWPTVHQYANADYDDITGWWSEQTGLDLTSFFDAWLNGATTPKRS